MEESEEVPFVCHMSQCPHHGFLGLPTLVYHHHHFLLLHPHTAFPPHCLSLADLPSPPPRTFSRLGNVGRAIPVHTSSTTTAAHLLHSPVTGEKQIKSVGYKDSSKNKHHVGKVCDLDLFLHFQTVVDTDSDVRGHWLRTLTRLLNKAIVEDHLRLE